MIRKKRGRHCGIDLPDPGPHRHDSRSIDGSGGEHDTLNPRHGWTFDFLLDRSNLGGDSDKRDEPRALLLGSPIRPRCKNRGEKNDRANVSVMA